MKDNHTKIEQLIQQAIGICGTDFALTETKSNLRRALASVAEIAAKRSKKHMYTERAKERASLNQKKWWEQIKENAKKSAGLEDLEKKEPEA
jgi:hypothetical protein